MWLFNLDIRCTTKPLIFGRTGWALVFAYLIRVDSWTETLDASTILIFRLICLNLFASSAGYHIRRDLAARDAALAARRQAGSR